MPAVGGSAQHARMADPGGSLGVPGIEIVVAGTVREAHAQLDLMGGQPETPITLGILDIGLPDGPASRSFGGLPLNGRRRWPSSRRSTVTTPMSSTPFLPEPWLHSQGRGRGITRSVSQAHRAWRAAAGAVDCTSHPRHFRGAAPTRPDEARLTGREIETLSLIARGLTVSEAATRLGLTPQTVASYVKVIYQKLNVTSRAQATREAIRRGLA